MSEELDKEEIGRWVDERLKEAFKEKLKTNGFRTAGDWLAIMEGSEVGPHFAVQHEELLSIVRGVDQEAYVAESDEMELRMLYGDPDAPKFDFAGLSDLSFAGDFTEQMSKVAQLTAPDAIETTKSYADMIVWPTPKARAELAQMGIYFK